MRQAELDPNVPESHDTLWLLAVSPTLWAVHFMLSYITAAIYCAKYAPAGASIDGVRWAIAGYTVGALIGIAVNGWSGLRRHRTGSGSLPHDFDSSADRHRFLGFATLLLAGLSAIATLYAAMVPFFFGNCR